MNILEITMLAYLVFSGFVVWRRPQMWCDGATALIVGAIVFVGAALIFQCTSLPAPQEEHWKTECIKAGGQLLDRKIERKDQYDALVTECVRK